VVNFKIYSMKKITKTILRYIFPVAMLASLFIVGSVKTTTLWEFYSGQGRSLPIMSERAITAAEFGIFQYKGSSEQNQQLVQYLEEESRIASGELLGYSVVSKYRTTLRSSMTASQATIPVSTIVTADGHTLSFSDLGSVVYLTIEPGTSREEIVKCTSIASSIWATCTRGLAFYGTSTASVPANAKSHNAGSIVVMSNVHYVYEETVDKDSDETLGGIKTFTSFPLIATSTALCATDGQFCTKRYVDTVGAGGFTSLNASSTRGLEVFGTAPETVGVKATSSFKFDDGGYLSPIVSTTGGIQFGSDGTSIDRSDSLVWTGGQTFNVVSTTNLIGTATTTLATTTILGVDTTKLVNGSNADALHSHSSSKKLYTQTNDINVTTSAETTVFSTTVPTSTLGTTGAIRIKMFIADMDGNGGTPSNIDFRVKYGGTTSTLTTLLETADANNFGWYDAEIIAAGATNSQQINQSLVGSTNANDGAQYLSYMSVSSSAIDSTVSQTLTVTVKSDTTQNNFIISSVIVEIVN